MKQTGKILKSARESQRISVNEVAMATKISPRLIQAIEEGDLDALPAKTFLRGFVQSYASYLKLDVDELLEKFHEEMGSTLPPISKPEDLAQDEPRETKKSPPVLHEKGILSKLIAGGVILALIFIIIGVKNIVEKYEKEATVETPPENIQGLNSNDALTSGAVTTTGNSPTKTEEIKNTETTKDLPKDSEPEPTPEMKSETATAVTAPIPTEAQTAPLAQATPAKTPELPTASAENKKETPEEKKPETT
ncbi:MAG: helix-turn-helix domain-containing protein, partial [Bdellovibrionales bacterium]|nr:helix-turn-helix domain-containing protein [Bdellovibrionales bacterium]